MFIHILLAENEDYIIHKRTFKSLCGPETFERYQLYSRTDGTLLTFATLEELNTYTLNNIDNPPKLGFVSKVVIAPYKNKIEAFNVSTNKNVTVTLDTDEDGKLSIHASWNSRSAADTEMARAYSRWLDYAFNLLDDFPYTGLKVDPNS